MNRSLSRRSVLRGVLALGGAVAIPLPTLDIMLNSNGNAYAQGSQIPVRYLTWFFGNGALPGMWVPTSTAADWELSPQLMPLAPVKEYLTVLSGYNGDIEEDCHVRGAGAVLAGGLAPGAGGRPGGPSICQLVADVTAQGTLFRSLEVGVTDATPNVDGAAVMHSIAHRSSDEPLHPEFDPRVVFDRLFANATPRASEEPSADPSPLLAVKRSVLDAVLLDGAKLRARLGSVDQQRLDSHLEGIRAIESRLVAHAQLSCAMPSRPELGPDRRAEATPEINSAMTDLVVLALSCGLTNVASYAFTLPAGHVYFRNLGADMNDNFHDGICHTDRGGHTPSDYQVRVHRGVIYTMQCFLEMLVKLKGVAVGDGNLLDHMLIYCTSEIAWGKTHSLADFPVLLAGKAGGKLRGTRHVRNEGRVLSEVLLSIAQGMGSSITQLGSGPLVATSGVPGLFV
jgi:hypothetical protein